jgi:hypothetical protein
MHKSWHRPQFCMFLLLLSFLGPVQGERPDVTQNSFHLSGHKQSPAGLYLIQIVYLYVCHCNCMCQTSCIANMCC